MSLGLLDGEMAIKMKEEFSRQIDILIQMWSEDEDKKSKEKLAELLSAKGVTEELIIEFHKKGYSISKIAESVDVPIARVMDVLSRIGEESDVGCSGMKSHKDHRGTQRKNNPLCELCVLCS